MARENVSFASPRGHHPGMTSVEVPDSIASALPSRPVLDITNEIRRELYESGRDSGIAYVSPLDEVALVRVQERESGFFADLEELLTRLVPQDERERERLLCILLGPRGEQIPFAAATSASASGSGSCCSASTGRRSRAGT